MMAVTRLRLYDTHPVPSSIHHDDMRMLLFRLDVSFYDVDVQNLTICDLIGPVLVRVRECASSPTDLIATSSY